MDKYGEVDGVDRRVEGLREGKVAMHGEHQMSEHDWRAHTSVQRLSRQQLLHFSTSRKEQKNKSKKKKRNEKKAVGR